MDINLHALTRRYETLKNDRNGWEADWAALAELFLPMRWRQDTNVDAHKRAHLNNRLMNSTGVLGMRTLAAGMMGGMTSPVRPWFRLRPVDERGSAGTVGSANEWIEEVTSRMSILLHQSNFYNSIHQLYADLGTFGTGLMVETADENGIYFNVVPCGEYVLDINKHGEVDCFFRRMYMTARQIVDKWGWDKAPEAVRLAAKGDGGTGGSARFDVIHGVFPRTDFDPSKKIGLEGKSFASVYFMPGGQSYGRGALLDEGGFNMFPAFAPRWQVTATDVYGRSPAMDVMPDTKMLQVMTASLRKMQHKIAEPPLIADSSLQQFGVDVTPDGLNYVNLERVKTPILPIAQPEAQALNFTMQSLQEVQQTVRDGLYTDLFRQLIDDTRRQITATEIQARQQEKMILIGPVVERLQKELLTPLIRRTYGLMQEWGALPEPPEDTDVSELDVEFESVLAQAQKLSSTSSIDQLMAFTMSAAQAAPEALDNLSWDESVKTYAERIGAPKNILASDREVEAKRKQRIQAQKQAEEQAAAQAQAKTAQTMTQAAKNMGQTPAGADGQTLMESLLGGLQ